MKQQLRTDDRAVSELLGAIFVFALLFTMVALAQVALVPTLNQQVEYEHSVRAQGDLQDLQGAITRTVALGGGETVPIEMGVTYPSRFLLLNPPPASGGFRTGEPIPDGVLIGNVSVPDDLDADEFWASLAEHGYESRILTYAPDYNEYGSASDTVIEGAVVYQRHADADVVSSRSDLVDGRRISIVVFEGDVATSRTDDLALDVSTVSGPAKTITVTDDGDPITVSVKTYLSNETWQERLGSEPYVVGVDYDDPDDDTATLNTLTITLEPDETYTLRMAKVGIGGGVDQAPAAYLTKGAAQTAILPENGGELFAEVRDAFNNPVAGTEVTFAFETIGGGTANLSWDGESTSDTVSTLSVRSDADGLATPFLNGTASSVVVNATIEVDGTAGTAGYETVSFGVQIGAGSDGNDNDGSDGATEINPFGTGYVSLDGAVSVGEGKGDGTALCKTTGNAEPCYVSLTLDNDAGDDVDVQTVRINAFSSDNKDNSPNSFPGTFDVLNGSSPDNGIVGQVGASVGGFPIPDGQSRELHIEFRDQNGDLLYVDEKDTLLVTITYADAPKSTYFVTF